MKPVSHKEVWQRFSTNPIWLQIAIAVVCLCWYCSGSYPPAGAQTIEQVRTDTQQTDAIVNQQKDVDGVKVQVAKIFARLNAIEADQATQRASEQSSQKTFAGIVGALASLSTVFQARLNKKVNMAQKYRVRRRRSRQRDEDDDEDEDDE